MCIKSPFIFIFLYNEGNFVGNVFINYSLFVWGFVCFMGVFFGGGGCRRFFDLNLHLKKKWQIRIFVVLHVDSSFDLLIKGKMKSFLLT